MKLGELTLTFADGRYRVRTSSDNGEVSGYGDTPEEALKNMGSVLLRPEHISRLAFEAGWHTRNGGGPDNNGPDFWAWWESKP